MAGTDTNTTTANAVFRGSVNMSGATSVQHKASSVTNAAIASAAGIAASKLQHRYKVGCDFGLDYDATPADVTRMVFVATADCTINSFKAMLYESGTSTDIDFDLLVNGATALSSVVTVVHGTGDRTSVSGTLSTTSLSSGDVVTIDLATTSTTGAQGPFAWVEIDEAAS